MWTIDTARQFAELNLREAGSRWRHVRVVGTLSESYSGLLGGSDTVAMGAWLHDVGYAREIALTGFHPLDGAVYLRGMGAPTALVALVAHHTGAKFEAEERGFADELDELPLPDPVDLDVLTLLDLVVGPSGELTTPEQRIEEILTRYGAEDPVHRAVTRSRASLIASAERARARLGLSEVWPLDVVEGVLKS